MERYRRFIAVPAFVVLLGTALPAHADTILIGSTAYSSPVPFGVRDYIGAVFTDGDVYQQLYASSSFSGPVLIEQIAFMVDYFGSQIGVATYDLSLALSTAATTIAAPSTTFAANRGTDYTTVFSGEFSAALLGDFNCNSVSCLPVVDPSPVLTFSITPFLYDPGKGDLLLEVTGIRYGVSFTNDRLNFEAGPDAATTSVYSTGLFDRSTSGDIHPESALQTEFTVTPASVPEPGAATLLVGGLFILLVERRRLRAQGVRAEIARPGGLTAR